MTPLVLASGSAIRQQILENAAVPFTVQISGVDEGAIKAGWSGGSPTDLAIQLAEAKALAVDAPDDTIVMGADQILSQGQRLFDKAKSVSEARDRLLMMRGQTHTLHSGLAAVRQGRVIWRHGQESRLKVRTFSDAFLDAYLKAGGEVLTKSVGAYAYEGLGAQLFECVEGDYFAILGLPLVPVLHLMRQEGVIAE